MSKNLDVDVADPIRVTLAVKHQNLKRRKQQLQVNAALKRRYSSRTFRYGYLVTT